MALKFLNKKGWHTGSLRNIENVWKAEQKHETEQKKLEELRKQIHEERERSEFRLLQEQAGLVPKQERLDFLYDSGLAVRKNSEGAAFKSLDAPPSTSAAGAASADDGSKQAPAVPGALFEEKPQSANDTWRKLHSDPLLLIRQREQEALARVKNNPVQMAMIRKSVEKKKHKEKAHDAKEHRKKHRHSKSKHQKHSSSKRQFDSENETFEEESRRNGSKSSKMKEHRQRAQSYSEDESGERNSRHGKEFTKHHKHSSSKLQSDSEIDTNKVERRRASVNNKSSHYDEQYRKRSRDDSSATHRHESQLKRGNTRPKISEEERARRLREMQEDAELHEEQRWKRLRKAENDDAKEATHDGSSRGKNFLHDVHKSVYGAEKGGSTTIEESVRRRTHYSQRTSAAREGNAFRR